jgi:hypothetical protein
MEAPILPQAISSRQLAPLGKVTLRQPDAKEEAPAFGEDRGLVTERWHLYC